MMKHALIAMMVSALVLSGGAFSLAGTAASGAASAPAVPEAKQTTPGLYLTAVEAYLKYRENPDKIRILDVRTPEEYFFVGHAPMAHNIPVMQFSYPGKPTMTDNANFATEVKKVFSPEETILVMCRSGARSAKAVNLMAAAGFKNVWNILDGFEGDAVKDPESYFDGKRVKNGWRNAGLPWGYDMDPALMYKP